jgi:undecaprenyl-diphosphatase
MTLIQAFILGIVQGLTEFLPISSSAHLVIVPALFHWDIPEQQAFIFDVLVQLGTLLAVIIYFWRDLLNIVQAIFQGLKEKKPFASSQALLGWYIILATIPAGILGLLIKDQVEKAFSSTLMTGIFLLVTAALLTLGEYFGKRTRSLDQITWMDALIIGVFQAISIFPGVSRSGSTITGGMLKSFDRTAAARFAFLMSIPILLAAGVLALKDLSLVSDFASQIPALIVGFVTAALVGYLAIRWLLGYLTHRSLYIFAVYCLIVGCLTIVFSIL